ncbi:hypothetical protein ACFWP3_01740 [Streptomyces sp. NPDC058525]|uniref:hypothetical protein n=1 Tax=unclassified Streptomyces TaxID=2593676 RepID=UPI003664A650
MDEQGGAGGVPLHDEQPGARHHRKPPRPDGHDGHDGKKTAAADTDEASRLDRPQQPEKPDGKGTRWVSPRDE